MPQGLAFRDLRIDYLGDDGLDAMARDERAGVERELTRAGMCLESFMTDPTVRFGLALARTDP